MTIVLDFGNDLPREVDFTDPGGSRVIDVETLPGRTGPAGPRGQAGPGSDELLARAASVRAVLPVQAALASGTLRVVMAGDSKLEGTGIKQLLQRSINQLATMLRVRYPISGGDQGVGHIPPRFWTAWDDDLADRRPTLTSIPAANQIGYQGGPGNRAVQMDTASAKVTYKAESFRYATVSFTQDAGAAGVFTVVVDGTVRATINTAPPQGVTVREARQRVDLGSVASRVVELRWVSGTPRVGGVLFQTSLTGITVEDHAHSGFNARHLAEGFVENGAPFSDDRLFEQIALAAPHLVVLGLGANDQGTYSDDTWRDYLIAILAKAKSAAPGAGIVLLHGAQRTDDVATDPGRVVRFEAAARAAIGDDPQVSIVYESLLWAPRAGTDYAWGGPEGWLLDTVHPSVLGHRRIAEALMALITSVDGASNAAEIATAAVAPAVADAAASKNSAAQSAAEVRTAMRAQFLTQDEGVAALIETAAGPKTRQALDSYVPPRARDRRVTDGGGPGPAAVNVNQGHVDNQIAADIGGGVIVGGGTNVNNNVIGGDGSATVGTETPNAAQSGTGAHYSVVGGYDNVAGGLASIVLGFHNYTGLGATHGTFGGGSYSKIVKNGSATNDYSTIGGGTRNTSTASLTVIGGGTDNVASGVAAIVGGGTRNVSSGAWAAVLSGTDSVASGSRAVIIGGSFNTATATASSAAGDRAVAREVGGFTIASGMFTAAGDQQSTTRVTGLVTTTAVTSTFQLLAAVQPNTSGVVSCHVVARDTATGDTRAWRVEAAVRRGASGATANVGAPTVTDLGGDSAASSWAVSTFAGTGTYSLRVTGQDSKTIRWVARTEYTEVA